MGNKELRKIILERYGHIAFNINENVKKEYVIKLLKHLNKVKRSGRIKRILKAYLMNSKSGINE